MLIQATKKLRDESLKQELAEYFGEEDVIETKAAVLKIELELGEYEAWRKIIVPLDYNFRRSGNSSPRRCRRSWWFR